MATKQLIVPCVHLNGTGKDTLLDDIDEAYMALSAAYDKLKRCAPNARDYYPYEAGAFVRAGQEHYARLRAIQNVQDELSAIVEGITDGEQFCEATVKE